jgi:hypothetical protein
MAHRSRSSVRVHAATRDVVRPRVAAGLASASSRTPEGRLRNRGAIDVCSCAPPWASVRKLPLLALPPPSSSFFTGEDPEPAPATIRVGPDIPIAQAAGSISAAKYANSSLKL